MTTHAQAAMLILAGITLLVLVSRDILHSAIPRGMSTGLCLAPFLVHRVLWPPFSFLVRHISSSSVKAEVLSLFAPMALLVLLTCWILLFVLGFGLITLGLGSNYVPAVRSLLDACYISAGSILTIGPVSDFAPKTGAVKTLMLAATLGGMVLISSIISLMFGLLSALQPREAFVSIISSAGGSPPSGIVLLEQYRGSADHDLRSLFEECHHWCADVLETHRSFPILPFFRSNDPLTSWLNVIGAVLDAIALLMSVAPEKEFISARMTYKLGCTLLREFLAIYKIRQDTPNPIGDDHFHQLYSRLEAMGYCTNEEDAARARYNFLRLDYAGAHEALSGYLISPVPPGSNCAGCIASDLRKYATTEPYNRLQQAEPMPHQ